MYVCIYIYTIYLSNLIYLSIYLICELCDICVQCTCVCVRTYMYYVYCACMRVWHKIMIYFLLQVVLWFCTPQAHAEGMASLVPTARFPGQHHEWVGSGAIGST